MKTTRMLENGQNYKNTREPQNLTNDPEFSV